MELAIDLAEQAGDLLLKMRADAPSSLETKANENDFVSAADFASEKLIIDGILGTRPNDAILGEEGGERPGTSGYRWVIDPLDGTRNYIDGFGPWAVSIGLEREGQSVLGIIRDAVNKETYVAAKGEGATCNGTPIHARSNRSLDQALVGVSLLPGSDDADFQARVVTAVIKRAGDFRRFGSAVMQLAKVASGALDATVSMEVKPWDIAAGTLIAAEAGAFVGDMNGGPATPACTIACGTSVSDELLALVRQAR